MSPGSRIVPATLLLAVLFCPILVCGIAAAHAPLSTGSNEGIARATVINDPEKSYVMYTALNAGGDPQYYRFRLQKGQILYGSLMVPGPDSPVPHLVLIGPGIEAPLTVPASIEVPAGSGTMLVMGKEPGKPSYEPFTPQPVYEVARFNVTASSDGDYYIAVFGPGTAKYGLAPGFKEEFTAAEWLLVPVSVSAIHLWEGQAPIIVFAPFGAVLIIGFTLTGMYRRVHGRPADPASWLILAAGLLYLGGAAMTGLQIVSTVLATGYSDGVPITLLLIAGPVLLGMYAVRTGVRPLRPDTFLRDGAMMALVGILGLLLWAGYLIGPLLALAAGGILFLRGSRKNMEKRRSAVVDSPGEYQVQDQADEWM